MTWRGSAHVQRGCRKRSVMAGDVAGGKVTLSLSRSTERSTSFLKTLACCEGASSTSSALTLEQSQGSRVWPAQVLGRSFEALAWKQKSEREVWSCCFQSEFLPRGTLCDRRSIRATSTFRCRKVCSSVQSTTTVPVVVLIFNRPISSSTRSLWSSRCTC